MGKKLTIRGLIDQVIDERASQICKERAQAQGIDRFKASMDLKVMAGIVGEANEQMNDFLIASVSAFCEKYKIDLNKAIKDVERE